MKKGIIFDLDGTLWDSAENVAAAWNIVIGTKYPDIKRHITAADMHGFMGKTLDEIGRLMLPPLDDETREAVMRDCCSYENEYLAEKGGTLYPSLAETLTRLGESFDLFIVSNCQAGYIECFLDYYGFRDFFADFECPGGTGLAKGENNKLVIRRNGIDRAVYVGDTQGDLDAADHAGIPFIHAAYGFGSVNRPTERILSIGELPEAAKRVLGG